jgi:molecular chaperone GrpE (heat shock protein)
MPRAKKEPETIEGLSASVARLTAKVEAQQRIIDLLVFQGHDQGDLIARQDRRIEEFARASSEALRPALTVVAEKLEETERTTERLLGVIESMARALETHRDAVAGVISRLDMTDECLLGLLPDDGVPGLRILALAEPTDSRPGDDL